VCARRDAADHRFDGGHPRRPRSRAALGAVACEHAVGTSAGGSAAARTRTPSGNKIASCVDGALTRLVPSGNTTSRVRRRSWRACSGVSAVPQVASDSGIPARASAMRSK
jgi:hypothetical protein